LQRHVADVVLHNTVIECQHSPISEDEIRERETFYGKKHKMVWLFDMSDNDNITINNEHDNYVTFRWKFPKKTVWAVRKTLYVDIGCGVLRIRKIHEETPCYGWGYLYTYDEFKMVVENTARCG
jgi:competence protein CoiA